MIHLFFITNYFYGDKSHLRLQINSRLHSGQITHRHADAWWGNPLHRGALLNLQPLSWDSVSLSIALGGPRDHFFDRGWCLAACLNLFTEKKHLVWEIFPNVCFDSRFPSSEFWALTARPTRACGPDFRPANRSELLLMPETVPSSSGRT